MRVACGGCPGSTTPSRCSPRATCPSRGERCVREAVATRTVESTCSSVAYSQQHVPPHARMLHSIASLHALGAVSCTTCDLYFVFDSTCNFDSTQHHALDSAHTIQDIPCPDITRRAAGGLQVTFNVDAVPDQKGNSEFAHTRSGHVQASRRYRLSYGPSHKVYLL